MAKRKRASNVRVVMEEIVFGVEDSLVSTVGVLTGIAAGSQSTYVVILSGLVLIAAEALSMTAGSYLSSKAGAEMWEREHGSKLRSLLGHRDHRPLEKTLTRHRLSKTDRTEIVGVVDQEHERWLQHVMKFVRDHAPGGRKTPLLAGAVMGVSYLAAGFVPLVSYLVLPVQQAILPSLILTAVALFGFGVWKGYMTSVSKWRSGLEMVVVAMSAAGIAYVIGLGVRAVL